jgi:SH3-like domain-containing protein
MKRTFIFTLLVFGLLVGTASAKRLTVAVEKANVRSGPGTGHDVLWSVGKYYPVDTVRTSKGWYQIRDFEGDMGWIHGSLLKKIPSVIVTGATVNVREGPETNFKVLFQAEKGVSFKLLKTQKKWLKVRHADGDVGWIHQSLAWGH